MERGEIEAARMTPREWQQQRRKEGRCPRCGVVVTDINPNTGEAYWRCAYDREAQRQAARERYQVVRDRQQARRVA